MENEKCHICGAIKLLKPAGRNKTTGKPYDAFMACPNYKSHDQYSKPQESESNSIAVPNNASGNDLKLVLDEVVALNGRMDKLGEYLKSKLG